MGQTKYLFYRLDIHTAERIISSLDSEYSCRIWRPSISKIVPPELPIRPFAVWWAMHHLGLFSNRDYSILVICKGQTLIHRSCVFPRYFRFPFMAKVDLQIGDTWTKPGYRGKGLATFALSSIILFLSEEGRRFWYVVSEDNTPSIRVVEKAGFTRVGEGFKSKRLGLSLFGSYSIQNQIHK